MMYLRRINVLALVKNAKLLSTGQSFEMTVAQRDLQERARDFVTREIFPVANELDKTGTFPHEIMKKAHKEGFLTANIPRKHGGGGLPLLDSCK